jgi:chromatin modification-related protein YNG2
VRHHAPPFLIIVIWNSCTELQQEIQKESSKYVRHALRNPGQAVGAKDQPIPEKVQEDYAEIARLGEEKVKLSQRVVQLVNRARARLDHDLARMLVLQGELDPSQQAAYASGALNGRNAAQSITDSLRQALAPQEPVFSSPALPQSATPANKSACFIRHPSMSLQRPPDDVTLIIVRPAGVDSHTMLVP